MRKEVEPAGNVAVVIDQGVRPTVTCRLDEFRCHQAYQKRGAAGELPHSWSVPQACRRIDGAAGQWAPIGISEIKRARNALEGYAVYTPQGRATESCSTRLARKCLSLA